MRAAYEIGAEAYEVALGALGRCLQKERERADAAEATMQEVAKEMWRLKGPPTWDDIHNWAERLSPPVGATDE